PAKVEGWGGDELSGKFDEILEVYLREKDLVENYNESELEEHFIRPILRILNHDFEVQETDKRGRRPDYAFFPDEETRRRSVGEKSEEKEFYRRAIGIGEAKEWEKPLDKNIGKLSSFDRINPSFQIDTYLRDTDKVWGILTNGRFWRIYYRTTSYQMTSYFEVDLADILERRDLEGFNYFYFFFRKEAFVPDALGKTFLDHTYEGSIDFAKKLGEGLKENVYRALRHLAEGFLRLKENRLEKDPGTIKEVHENSLVFLYRILFILYAESMDLLDTSNPVYNETYSFNFLKHEVAERMDKGKGLYEWRAELWDRLNKLFGLINEGSDAKGIPKDELFIPPYNGGLFDPKKHRFLVKCKADDWHLSKVIDLLSRSSNGSNGGSGFIDYSSLDIRHLGSIYEGLLEYKLRVAEEDMVCMRINKKEVWLPERKGEGKKVLERCGAGEVYLATDKGERKATGSYYTPDYIVKYIVENTLGPLVKERMKVAREKGKSLREAILSIRVLDPAMGSGHFLVEAVDTLSSPFLDAVNEDVEKGFFPKGDYSTEWAKREIVSHCIYGVDLNPLAVELAKLSLWLRTIARDKPLNFLDHRLKCGNSLIGAELGKLTFHPNAWKRGVSEAGTRLDISQPKAFVKKVEEMTKGIEAISDNEIKDIKIKEEKFNELQNSKAYLNIKALADLFTSVYFGNKVKEKRYAEVSKHVYGGDKLYRTMLDIKIALALADEKRFFHWELEFPEIFFESGKLKENPGFDAVIGNPPYDVLAEKELGYPVDDEKFFFKSISKYYPATDKKLNLYRLFTVKGLGLTKKGMRFSFIIPMTILGDDQAARTRKWILDKLQLENIEAFPQKDDPYRRVFFDAKLPTAIIVITKDKQTHNTSVVTHPGKLFEETSKYYKLNQKKIQLLDVHSLSIPLLTEDEWALCERVFLSDWVKKIGDQYHSYQGEINETTMKRFLTKEPIGPEILRGGVVQRYELLDTPKQGDKWFLDLEKYKNEVSDKSRKAHVDCWRIGYQRNSALDNYRRIIATVIPSGEHFFDSISYLIPEEEERFFFLAVLNSNLLEFRFRFTSTNNHVNGYEIEALPIRTINFTTPSERRKALVEEAKQLYQDYLTTTDHNQILDFVETLLPKDKDGNFITEKEKSDVVHDFLAYLAEQMIELNKEKQKEMKGFLKWLEAQLHILPDKKGNEGIDALTGKSRLKNYLGDYQKGEAHLTFSEFYKLLEKNKKRIQANLRNRELFTDLEKWYETSLNRLLPV
ncbi:MAG: N-6 DNA methylase, partial [Thermoplasmata archaeon]|nr:N-6 DNA methylase [Thermoplasmata archaeon]